MIVTRYGKGDTVQAISGDLDLSAYVIGRVLSEAGVTMHARGRPPSVTAEVGASIRERYERGESSTSLATEFGVSTTTIRNAVLAAGGTIRPRGRARGSAVGEQSGVSVLTEADVMELRRRYATGTASLRELGKEFGVTGETVRGAVTGRHWSHLPGALPVGLFPQGVRPGFVVPPSLDPETDAVVAKRYREGASMGQLADDLHVTVAVIYASLGRSGTERRAVR